MLKNRIFFGVDLKCLSELESKSFFRFSILHHWSSSDPDPLLSPMVISWLVSGLTFIIAVIIIITVAKVLCHKERKPSELERETRTCEFPSRENSYFLFISSKVIEVFCFSGVDNTYVALSINKL